jgi:hypothetical protein
MQTAALGLTCKAAFEAFAQNQTLELQKRVNELELEVYHLKLPQLRDCMHVFNHVKLTTKACTCMYCGMSGRSAEDSDRGFVHPHDCLFKPQWESYLESIGATVAVGYDPVANNFDEANSGHGTTTACIYNFASADWHNCGWGRPLVSLNDSRKLVWDRIVADCNWPEDE